MLHGGLDERITAGMRSSEKAVETRYQLFS